MRWAALILALAATATSTVARRHRKRNEIGVVNLADANVRLWCQSIRTDKGDRFLGPDQHLRFQFYDIDPSDMHFWCDAYGLFGFFESFDVFGGAAPSQRNQTWFIKSDGLYYSNPENRVAIWKWQFPPFDSYATDVRKF